MVAMTELWSYYAYMGLFLVASIFLSNAIAWLKQFRQQSRIRSKTTALSSPRQKDAIIPVTILSGFLGAGKTTLLNRILSSPDHGFKIMILENEVGAVSIDHKLIAGVPRDGVVVMQNGCICCSAAARNDNELERILDHLLRVQADTLGFDYLVIETTGLADPGPIVQTFLELRASRFRLDGVVTLVDASTLLSKHQPEMPSEMLAQLLYADVVALTKTDLVPEDDNVRQRTDCERVIRSLNPDARILSTTTTSSDVETLLNIRTFDASRYAEQLAKVSLSGHAHTANVSTILLTTRTELVLQPFGLWLNEMVATYASDSNVFRIKGIVALGGENYKWVLQGVLDTYTLAPSTLWHVDEARSTQIMLIGKDLNESAIRAAFQTLCKDDDDDARTFKDKEV